MICNLLRHSFSGAAWNGYTLLISAALAESGKGVFVGGVFLVHERKTNVADIFGGIESVVMM